MFNLLFANIYISAAPRITSAMASCPALLAMDLCVKFKITAPMHRKRTWYVHFTSRNTIDFLQHKHTKKSFHTYDLNPNPF